MSKHLLVNESVFWQTVDMEDLVKGRHGEDLFEQESLYYQNKRKEHTHVEACTALHALRALGTRDHRFRR